MVGVEGRQPTLVGRSVEGEVQSLSHPRSALVYLPKMYDPPAATAVHTLNFNPSSSI
jgi:hypothetical protein